MKWSRQIIIIYFFNFYVFVESLSKNYEMKKYTTSRFYDLVKMLSGFTTNVGDIRDWVDEYYPSIYHDESIDIKHVTREYIHTKMSFDNDWKHFKHRAFPGYQLRVRRSESLKMDPVVQYSGYIDNADKHYFFMFFESRNSPMRDPVVLWLNGGPGCSSLVGCFYTLGPSKLDDNGKLYYNPWSWNRKSSIIFLDQPVDVGFSYSEKIGINSTVSASFEFFVFLSLFFHVFPQYSHQDFHIAGESYAGHYIPMFASEILMNQEYGIEPSEVNEKLKELPTINLKTVMIGNGYVDPYNQFPFYYFMGCEDKKGPILSKETCSSMKPSVLMCRRYIEICQEFILCPCVCITALLDCWSTLLTPYHNVNKKEDFDNIINLMLGRSRYI